MFGTLSRRIRSKQLGHSLPDFFVREGWCLAASYKSAQAQPQLELDFRLKESFHKATSHTQTLQNDTSTRDDSKIFKVPFGGAVRYVASDRWLGPNLASCIHILDGETIPFSRKYQCFCCSGLSTCCNVFHAIIKLEHSRTHPMQCPMNICSCPQHMQEESRT